MGKQQPRTFQSINYTICLVLIFSFFFSSKGHTQCLPGDIGGVVFLELPAANASTANTYGVNDVNESGIAGVQVAVIDPGGTILFDTTDAFGIWNITPAAYPVRVEFSWMDSWLEPAPNALATANTDVQIYTATDCAANLGLYYPDEYCNMTPDVVTTCYVSGDPLAGGSTAPIDAVVSFQYDWLNDTIAPYHDAIMSEVGGIWGVAYSRRTENAFFASIMKRHVGLGPNGIGGLYRVDYSTGTPAPSSFIDLSLLGVDVGTEPSRSLSTDYDLPNTDSLMFDAAGKLGLGDLEISDDGNTLFVVNLKSKKVVTVDLTTFNLNGTIPGAAQIDSLPALPALACNNGESRPFALKYRRGKLYVGAVCTAENGGTSADLTAIVYEYDLTAGTWAETINEFSLDYTKGGAQDNICTTWSPWIGNYDSPFTTCRPTPMFTDIEFDSDLKMILVFADRYTFQKFTLQRDSADTGSESVINGGDVLRAYYNGTNYSVESGGIIPGGDGCGANGQGIGGGEFFCGDSIGTEHSEIILGAAAVLSGTGEVMLTTINPVSFNSGGVRRFNTTTGSSDTTMGYQLYETPGSSFPNGNGFAVKGGGVGDLELLCETPPIEIYSFIWNDTNNDGIQDPDEAGIPNIDVSLYDVSGNLLWVDSTDATGFFSFSDTLMAFTDYYLVIGSGDFDLLTSTLNDSLSLTLPNTGMGANVDKNDSDFTIASGVNPAIDGYPTFAFTTGNNGSNYHGFDVGFFPPCTNPELVTADTTICNGSSVDMTTLVTDTQAITGTLSFYISLADANAETNAIAALVAPTDTTPYYVRKNATDITCFDIDSLIVQVNPLPNLLTNDLTICNGDTININVGVSETTSIPHTLSYYTTYADAVAETNALASASVFPTDTTEYYIRANAMASPNCSAIDSLMINVDPLPILLTTDIDICSGDTTNLATNVSETTGLPVTYAYYPTYADALAETNALATTFVFPTDTTQYFVRVNPTSVSTCSVIDSLVVNSTFCPDYDLALKMVLAAGQTTNVDPGDTVTYTMWVYNQGNMPSYDIVLTHYASSDMAFDNTIATNLSWQLVGGNPTDTLVGPLAAGDSISIDLAMIVNNFYSGASINSFTEISSSDDDTDDMNTAPTDEDSVTDSDDTNDLSIDDEINDTPDNPADDDDHDGSLIFINSVFDLAFAMNADSDPVAPCDTLTYTSWIHNQGNSPAFNVDVTNYLATGMNFDGTIAGNAAWTLVGGNPTATIAGPIAPGDSASVTIALMVDCAFAGTSIDNTAELSGYDDDTDGTNAGPVDEDSVTDTDGTNDLNIDNEINDNPDNPADDDDHDGASIAVTQSSSFDLALLMPTPVNPVNPCDTVIYDIWVYNQGSDDAYSISVANYVGAGMSFDASIAANVQWTLAGGTPVQSIAGPIAAGDSSMISIALVVDCNFTGSSTNNVAEIIGYDDDTDGTNAGPTDEDSVTDLDPTNDFNIDDEINDNPDNPADDDDHDGALIAINQIFDLAMLMQNPTGSINPCDTVSYTMIIYNQGTMPAYNVMVTDYLPAGMIFDATLPANAGWALVAGEPTITVAGPIAAGSSDSVSISLILDCAYAGMAITNAAEISGADNDTDNTNAGPTDADSVTDADGTNDQNIDDEINNNPDDPADDDDHDGATTAVNQGFDLALTMAAPANPVGPCDTVTYTIWVYNQGNIAAYNIALSNYTPTGMTFDPTIATNAGWAMVSGLPTYVMAGPLAGGDSISVDIALVVDCGTTLTSTNNAVEISAYDDDTDNTNAGPTDEDSVTDTDSTNDLNIDNEYNDAPDNPGDDDDHDGAVITIVIPPTLTIDTLYYTTPFETSVPNICVDLTELGAPVDMTVTCNFPANGVLVLNSPSECVTYVPASGYTGQDTACVAICDAVGNCDTTILIITIEAGCGNIVAPSILTADLADCTLAADFCLDIPIADVNLYNFQLDGNQYSGGIQGCDFDTTYVYTYSSIPGSGSAGPYMIDLWAVGGTPFSGLVQDMQGLTDSMNVWDPAGNWMIDVGSSSIRGGSSNTYTDIDVTQMGSGTPATIPLTLSLVPNGISINIASGHHEFVINETAIGCRDTIDIMVNCPGCNDVFAGPYTIEADNCGETASFCTPIILSEIFNYSISDNGSPFTGLFGGCDNDTIILYNYVSIPGNGTSGPYEVDNWTVNGFDYGGIFQDIPALLDSMNTWDASGNWSINGFNIEGGNYLNTYGNIVVSQFGTVVSILNPNIQLVPSSAAVFLDPGAHELIFTDTLTGCVDTAMVQVDCIDCDDIVDDMMALTVSDCDATANFCMAINPNDITNYTVTVNGQLHNGSFLGCNNDTLTTYLTIGFSNPGTYVLDSWTVDGTTYSAISFANAQELVDSMNVWNPAGSWSLSGLLIVGGNNTSTYSSILVSSGGMNVANAEPNIQLFPSSTAIALDTGSYMITILENLTGCLDSSAVTVACPPALDACDFIADDFVPLALPGCVGEAALCVEVSPEELGDYMIFDNGSLFTGTTGGCEFDSLVVYDYSFLTGGGNFGPYLLDSWTLNGQMFSGQFDNVADLVDSLNTWDPLASWSNDVTNSNIRGPAVENIYGALEITHISSNTSVTLPVEHELNASNSTFGMSVGSHELVFVNQVTGCTDTVDVLVACIDPAVYTDTIEVGEIDTLCFDLDELPGLAGGMVNFCEESSGEYVVFDFLAGSYCLTATGIEVGVDSACIEICDDLGFCDTTWVTVVVGDGSLLPTAWPDVDTTTTGVAVDVTVTNNDVGGVLGIDTFIILNQPTNGAIIVDYVNGTLEYTPNSGYCNSTVPDVITYSICNAAGCDTSTVSVYVLCSDLGFVSGFSPNGDGVNDFFMIEGIGNYPGHTLSIFNRWGNQVFYSEDYKNDWSGTFNKDTANLPDGTYFYVFEDGQGNSYSGYIQIQR